jgi:hypothetical protein
MNLHWKTWVSLSFLQREDDTHASLKSNQVIPWSIALSVQHGKCLCWKIVIYWTSLSLSNTAIYWVTVVFTSTSAKHAKISFIPFVQNSILPSYSSPDLRDSLITQNWIKHFQNYIVFSKTKPNSLCNWKMNVMLSINVSIYIKSFAYALLQ